MMSTVIGYKELGAGLSQPVTQPVAQPVLLYHKKASLSIAKFLVYAKTVGSMRQFAARRFSIEDEYHSGCFDQTWLQLCQPTA